MSEESRLEALVTFARVTMERYDECTRRGYHISSGNGIYMGNNRPVTDECTYCGFLYDRPANAQEREDRARAFRFEFTV